MPAFCLSVPISITLNCVVEEFSEKRGFSLSILCFAFNDHLL
jgi:hypothetical protein